MPSISKNLNRTQFYDAYTRTSSFFEGSELASSGLPEGLGTGDPESLEANCLPSLSPRSSRCRSTIRPRPIAPESAPRRGSVRRGGLDDRRAAAGEQGAGEQFRMEFLAFNPDSEITGPFINTLRRLGIDATLRIIDTSQYINRQRAFDYRLHHDGAAAIAVAGQRAARLLGLGGSRRCRARAIWPASATKPSTR
jgi:microcin C transport system substrate-binding protein